MKIAIGNDHAAPKLKFEIMEHLQKEGYEVINFGGDTDERDNYPERALPVAEAIVNGEADLGILICGTGIGISMAANKVPGIRAAVCSEPVSARLAREHNHANIIAFGERIVGPEEAKGIVDAFLNATPQGGRHEMRVGLITEIEKKYSKS